MRSRDFSGLMHWKVVGFANTHCKGYPVSDRVGGRTQSERWLRDREVSLRNTKIERGLPVEILVTVVSVVEALFAVRVYHVILDDLGHDTAGWNLGQVVGGKVGIPRSEEAGGGYQEVCGNTAFGSLSAGPDGFADVGVHLCGCEVGMVSKINLVAEMGIHYGEG